MNTFSKLFALTMSGICLFTILIPSVMDVNDTHMTNPLWTPHARFHWAIQYLSATLMSILALLLLWLQYKEKRSLLSIFFIGFSPLMFWGMFFPALLMPGTGTWPDGVNAPASFPELFKIIHPNFIMAAVITPISVVVTLREYRMAKRI